MFSIGQYLSQVKAGSSQEKTPTSKSLVVTKAEDDRQGDDNDTGRDYSVLLRTGENDNRRIQSSIEDLKPLRQRQKNVSLRMPTAEEIQECTERTRRALQLVLESRSKNLVQKKKDKTEAEYIRYTSSNVLNDSATSSRIIKIVDKQEDPMAPPKFKQKKHMARPSSPPAPVLHAPIRKATAEEQKAWYIPPAISNWKNPNGFTIALDKRLAVDGKDPSRNVNSEATINTNTINLAEALHKADQEAREEIRLRNALKKRIAEKETREKEAKLRELAQRSRESKSRRQDDRYEDDAARERALAREERMRKAEREIKMSRMGKEQRNRVIAKSLGDRDISERTQLGLAKSSNTNSAEIQFDQRLFTNATQVTNSEDQPYDNPLFVQQAVNSIYKVSDTTLNDHDIDDAKSSGPVEFEKSEGLEVDEDSLEYGLQYKRPKH